MRARPKTAPVAVDGAPDEHLAFIDWAMEVASAAELTASPVLGSCSHRAKVSARVSMP